MQKSKLKYNSLASLPSAGFRAGRARSQNLEKGFTIIELLAVMVVLVIISGIVLSIIFSSLRATKKTNILSSVKQNGSYVISQMEKAIRGAKKFGGVSTNDTSPITYNVNCVQPTAVPGNPTPTPIPYHALKITSFDDSQTEFYCSTSGIFSNSNSLIDSSILKVDSCSFICNQSSSSESPTIDINFSLLQKTSNSLAEEKASVSFKTSATMRNLNN